MTKYVYPTELISLNETVMCHNTHTMYTIFGSILQKCVEISSDSEEYFNVRAQMYDGRRGEIVPASIPMIDVIIQFPENHRFKFYELNHSFGIQYPGWNIEINKDDFEFICSLSKSPILRIDITTRLGTLIRKRLVMDWNM